MDKKEAINNLTKAFNQVCAMYDCDECPFKDLCDALDMVLTEVRFRVID